MCHEEMVFEAMMSGPHKDQQDMNNARREPHSRRDNGLNKLRDFH